MVYKPLFEGLVVDERDQLVNISYVGQEPFYVVDDQGFHRHIPSEQVDRQVLESMNASIKGNEEIISEKTAKMLGQDDIFTRAMIESQLKNMEKQFEIILKKGIPEDGRVYMGMTGFKIRVNIHGEVIEVIQPGKIETDE